MKLADFGNSTRGRTATGVPGGGGASLTTSISSSSLISIVSSHSESAPSTQNPITIRPWEHFPYTEYFDGCFKCKQQGQVECVIPAAQLSLEYVVRMLQGELRQSSASNIPENCFISKDDSGNTFYMCFDTHATPTASAITNEKRNPLLPSSVEKEKPKDREKENVIGTRYVILCLYGCSPPDPILIKRIKEFMDSKLEDLRARNIASQLSRSTFNATYIPQLKSGNLKQIDLNLLLPNYITDIFLFLSIARQELSLFQLLSTEGSTITNEKKLKEAVETATLRHHSVTGIPSDSASRVEPQLQPQSQSQSQSQPQSTKNYFEHKTLKRSTHVPMEIVPEDCHVQFNQHDFTFLYNSFTFKLVQQIGRGLALIEMSFSPSETLTASPSQLQTDVYCIVRHMKLHRKLHLTTNLGQSYVTSDQPPNLHSYGTASSPGRKQETTGLEAITSNGFAIKIQIFPAIPTQTEALIDFIKERLDHSIVIYCMERLHSSIRSTDIPAEMPNDSMPLTCLFPYKSWTIFLQVQHTLLKSLKVNPASSNGSFSIPWKLPFHKALTLMESVASAIIEAFPSLRDVRRSFQCWELMLAGPEDEDRKDLSLQWARHCYLDEHLSPTCIVFGGSLPYVGYTDSNTQSHPASVQSTNKSDGPTRSRKDSSATATSTAMLSANSTSSSGSSIGAAGGASAMSGIITTDMRQLSDCEPFARTIEQLALPIEMFRRGVMVEIAIDPSGFHLFFANVASKYVERLKNICSNMVKSASSQQKISTKGVLSHFGINYEPTGDEEPCAQVAVHERKESGTYIDFQSPSGLFNSLDNHNKQLIDHLVWGRRKKILFSSQKYAMPLSECLQQVPIDRWKRGVEIFCHLVALPPCINSLMNEQRKSTVGIDLTEDSVGRDDVIFSAYVENLSAISSSNGFDIVRVVEAPGDKCNNVYCIFPIPYTASVIVVELRLCTDARVLLIQRVMDVDEIVPLSAAEKKELLSSAVTCKDFSWQLGCSAWDTASPFSKTIKSPCPTASYSAVPWKLPLIRAFMEKFFLHSYFILYEQILFSPALPSLLLPHQIKSKPIIPNGSGTHALRLIK